MEKTILHKADTRGDANHGWLHSRHTFSFAGYYDPDRVHFGALHVLNDDRVEAGMGFGTTVIISSGRFFLRIPMTKEYGFIRMHGFTLPVLKRNSALIIA